MQRKHCVYNFSKIEKSTNFNNLAKTQRRTFSVNFEQKSKQIKIQKRI